jgi:ABC-type multidrug transport system permease subunit
MYRATPLTYYIAGIMSTGLSGLDIKCESHDIVYLPRIPTGDTCASYLSLYISRAGGTLLNPGASSDCQICPYSDAKALLAEYGMYFSRRWRDFGISVAYNGINVALIFLLYWATRARKTGSHQQS